MISLHEIENLKKKNYYDLKVIMNSRNMEKKIKIQNI